jgi:solute carrier family 39 (zinc transporter), member 9
MPKHGLVDGSSSSPADRVVTSLMIHCASDGLAMGTAALSGSASVSMMVGAAMILHKAPMAFGLTSYLAGPAVRWPWAKTRPTLVAFCSVAPLSALATYAALLSLPGLASPTMVALCLLFSGGTFLYAAAVHVLPEVLGGAAGPGGVKLAAVVAGGLAPVMLSWGHSH